MSYYMVKSWDNHREAKAKRLPTVNGRTWTRRIRWLEDSDKPVKLKFDDGEQFTEVAVSEAFAQVVWDRFKTGAVIEDAISLFNCAHVTPSIRGSRRKP